MTWFTVTILEEVRTRNQHGILVRIDVVHNQEPSGKDTVMSKLGIILCVGSDWVAIKFMKFVKEVRESDLRSSFSESLIPCSLCRRYHPVIPIDPQGVHGTWNSASHTHNGRESKDTSLVIFGEKPRLRASAMQECTSLRAEVCVCDRVERPACKCTRCVLKSCRLKSRTKNVEREPVQLITDHGVPKSNTRWISRISNDAHCTRAKITWLCLIETTNY